MNRKANIRQVLLNAPYTLWAAIFVVVPLLFVAYYAFTDSGGNFTLENLSNLSRYANVFKKSLLYSVIATIITLFIAYPFAYFMSKRSANVQRVQMMLVMLPMWMNLLIRTYSWTLILERNGIINNFLELFGIEPLKLIGTPGAVILGMIYNYLPYMILPIYTVLSKIDVSILEAAEDLGCNSFNKFRRVVLPLSISGVVSGIVMVFVPSVSTFYISQKLGSESEWLIGDNIEYLIKSTTDGMNVAAALSLVLMIIILASMAIMNRFADSSDGGMIV
ncbi:MAG: ABC transporter permease [Oscillospiraceae bacterium]|nr:ABC transporter permease [Oscillospiraceae bacterium]